MLSVCGKPITSADPATLKCKRKIVTQNSFAFEISESVFHISCAKNRFYVFPRLKSRLREACVKMKSNYLVYPRAMALYDSHKQYLLGLRRRRQLENKDFSVICNNCFAGVAISGNLG